VIHTVLWVNLIVDLKLLNNNENHKAFAHNVDSISTFVKSAKKRIVLIDNYVDETVLTLLDKRDNNVSAIIYTQYAPIDVETFRLSHDRFLCIDDDVYHIGASIKDLGKKWSGFSKMEILTPDKLVERINRG